MSSWGSWREEFVKGLVSCHSNGVLTLGPGPLFSPVTSNLLPTCEISAVFLRRFISYNISFIYLVWYLLHLILWLCVISSGKCFKYYMSNFFSLVLLGPLIKWTYVRDFHIVHFISYSFIFFIFFFFVWSAFWIMPSDPSLSLLTFYSVVFNMMSAEFLI